eukprot:UN04953
MQIQDQIEVQFQNVWYKATICEIAAQTVNTAQNGKKFKVHYNRKDVPKRFEWFWSKRQSQRLRVPNQIMLNPGGVGVGIHQNGWTEPPLASNMNPPINNVHELKVGHHIYVKHKVNWYRCEVEEIKESHKGKTIQITYLVGTFWNNEEWLKLYVPTDKQRISLNDK